MRYERGFPYPGLCAARRARAIRQGFQLFLVSPRRDLKIEEERGTSAILALVKHVGPDFKNRTAGLPVPYRNIGADYISPDLIRPNSPNVAIIKSGGIKVWKPTDRATFSRQLCIHLCIVEIKTSC